MSENHQKNVLVTGASSGIGKACAIYMAKKGYSVIGTSRSLSKLSSVEKEVKSHGLHIKTVELDINSENSIEDTIPYLVSTHGVIDVLINNAGYGLWGPVDSISIAEMESQMKTNFFAPFRLMNAVLPGMLNKHSGTIINISSILGRIGTPFNGAYVASKFAMEGLSESMRIELWPLGIRVVLLEPGYIKTDFHKNQVTASKAYSTKSRYGTIEDNGQTQNRAYFMLSQSPVKVAKKIHSIVQSNNPKFRYTINKEATIGALCARFIPERIFQSILSRTTM